MTAILQVYNRYDLEFDHGKGVYLFTDDGTRYLDFAAGIAVNALGHCHPAMVETLQTQGAKLWHVSNMYHIQGMEKLATTICNATDFADQIFFCNSGVEAVECGLKMVRRYHDGVGNPDKYRVITFEGCFHGRSLATISAGKKAKLMEGFYPEMDGFDQVPHGDLEAVKAAITPETGGILIEPVQGEGGIRPASKEFLQGLRNICDEHDLVLFFDGIQCGMGRTGKLFSHEWSGVKPDIVSSAKGIAGGFPFGACLANNKVAQHMHVGSHGSTYGGNPLGTAISQTVMDIMLADGFLDSVVHKGEYLMSEIEELAKRHANIIKGARGKGLMIGLQLAKTQDSVHFVNQLRAKKLLTVAAADNVVRILPPLTITESEMNEGIAIIQSVCEEMK